MFTHFIVQPIFNLLVLVYALLPGHNFGLSLIIFTVIVRLLMWPLVKRQLHQTKIMRKLQPQLREIKKKAAGDRTKESALMMELYKENGVNPLATFPTLIVQLIILLGLYSGLRKVITDPSQIVQFAYPGLQHLGWMEHLHTHITDFDDTLFGVINLKRTALGGSTYIPALLLVIGSAAVQFLTSRQLMPTDKNARRLRDILKSAGNGQQADQAEVNAAVGRSTQFLIPFMVFIFTVNLPAALSLYWFTGGAVAFIQQYIALREDEVEMEKLADSGKPQRDVSKIAEAEVVAQPTAKPSPKKPQKKKGGKRRKR